MTRTIRLKKGYFPPMVLIVLVFIFWHLMSPRDYLLVTTVREGRNILVLPLTQGADFTIGYIHSVDHSPVFEVFSVKPGARGGLDLYIRETYFRMFGAGMGHWAGHGRLVSRDGWTRIENIDRKLGQFVLRIGSPGVDHTIIHGSRKINLSALAPGRPALVRAAVNNRLKAFFNLWPQGPN